MAKVGEAIGVRQPSENFQRGKSLDRLHQGRRVLRAQRQSKGLAKKDLEKNNSARMRYDGAERAAEKELRISEQDILSFQNYIGQAECATLNHLCEKNSEPEQSSVDGAFSWQQDALHLPETELHASAENSSLVQQAEWVQAVDCATHLQDALSALEGEDCQIEVDICLPHLGRTVFDMHSKQGVVHAALLQATEGTRQWFSRNGRTVSRRILERSGAVVKFNEGKNFENRPILGALE